MTKPTFLNNKPNGKSSPKSPVVTPQPPKPSKAQSLFWWLLMFLAIFTIISGVINAILTNLPYDLDEVSWDYSDIWGGMLMLLLAYCIGATKDSCKVKWRSLCKVLAMVISIVVFGFAVNRLVYALSTGDYFFVKKDLRYHSSNKYDRVFVAGVIFASTTAALSLIYFLLMLFSMFSAAKAYLMNKYPSFYNSSITTVEIPNKQSTTEPTATTFQRKFKEKMLPFVSKIGDVMSGWNEPAEGAANGDVEKGGPMDMAVEFERKENDGAGDRVKIHMKY